MEASPSTKVLTAEAMRWTMALSDNTGLLAKLTAIAEVNKYNPHAREAEMPEPTKQRRGVGGTGSVLDGLGEGSVMDKRSKMSLRRG